MPADTATQVAVPPAYGGRSPYAIQNVDGNCTRVDRATLDSHRVLHVTLVAVRPGDCAVVLTADGPGGAPGQTMRIGVRVAAPHR